MDEELTYEQRANITLAHRLLAALKENGIIGDYIHSELRYPSMDAILDAEEQMK